MEKGIKRIAVNNHCLRYIRYNNIRQHAVSKLARREVYAICICGGNRYTKGAVAVDEKSMLADNHIIDLENRDGSNTVYLFS